MAGKMKGRGNLTQKVDEIKRMQANWMKERSLDMDNRESMEEMHKGGGGGARRSRDKASRKCAQANSKSGTETISWGMGNSAKKKPPSTLNSTKPSNKQQMLRTRSASPARSTSNPAKSSSSSSLSSSSKTSKKNNSRPSSARSTTSEGSRPPSGRNIPSLQSEKLSSTDHKRRTVDHESISSRSKERTDLQSSRGHLGDRFHSEPNLNEFERSDRDERTVSGRLHGDIGDYDSGRGLQSTRSVAHVDGGQDLLSTYSLGHGQDDPCRVEGGHSSSRGNGSDLKRRPRPKPSLDPDAFDRLADQIANRVKAEMRDERLEIMNLSGYPSQITHDDETDVKSEGYIKGHHCSKCKQLMIPPDHSATLLVPCGHTLCEACAEDRIKCPTCRTKVSSTSLNSTLQEIISSSRRPTSGTHPLASRSQAPTNHITSSDVNQNHVSTHSTNHHADNHRTHEYAPSRYADEGHLHSTQEGGNVHHAGGYNSDMRTRDGRNVGSEKVEGARRRKMSPKEEARKLEDEYQSLGIRCEALESEEADVMERVEVQNREIAKHKQQMGNIAQKQQQMREEIKVLEKKVSDLEGHRQEYRRQVEDAEDRKKEELDQLAMVRTMLRDMQRNRERVKMSARKLNISLD